MVTGRRVITPVIGSIGIEIVPRVTIVDWKRPGVRVLPRPHGIEGLVKWVRYTSQASRGLAEALDYGAIIDFQSVTALASDRQLGDCASGV